MSYTVIVLVVLFWLTLFVSLFVSVAGQLAWLDFLYLASYIKLAVTLIKYIPQVSYINTYRGISATTAATVLAGPDF